MKLQTLHDIEKNKLTNITYIRATSFGKLNYLENVKKIKKKQKSKYGVLTAKKSGTTVVPTFSP